MKKIGFWKLVGDIFPGVVQKFILRRSWNKISSGKSLGDNNNKNSGRGLYITTDQVHLNERAGIVAVNMVEQFLIKPKNNPL